MKSLTQKIKNLYLFRMGQYYKTIGRHDLAGPIFAKLNLFPEFDFVELTEGEMK